MSSGIRFGNGLQALMGLVQATKSKAAFAFVLALRISPRAFRELFVTQPKPCLLLTSVGDPLPTQHYALGGL